MLVLEEKEGSHFQLFRMGNASNEFSSSDGCRASSQTPIASLTQEDRRTIKECKQCPHSLSRAPKTSPATCANTETRSSSLSEMEEMYFNRMAADKDDTFLDDDDSAADATSSTEDIPSLESSLQASTSFGELRLPRYPVASRPEDITRTEKSSTFPMQLSNTGTFQQFTVACPSQEMIETNDYFLDQKCNSTDGAGEDQDHNASDSENAMESEDQDSFPLLIRSMSSSRRHSWEGPLSPSVLGGARRRLSLDLLGIDSDGEGDREDEGQFKPSAYELLQSHITEDNRQVTGIQGKTRLISPEDEMTEQEIERTEMRPRLDADCSYSFKGIQNLSFRNVATSQSRDTESRTSPENQEEKENLEPNHLLVQQVLQELKAFHGQCNNAVSSARTASGSAPLHHSASPHNLTWMEFLAEKEDDDKSDRPEKGTKVKRTLSSLKNRMTGSFKDKGKTKEKEKESPKEKRKCNNGHELVPGSFSSSTNCTLCSKSLNSKTSYQCMNCAVNVHKNCRNLLAECSISKNKLKDSQQKQTGNPQTTTQHGAAFSVKEQTRCPQLVADGMSGTVRNIGMTIPPRRPSQPSFTASSVSNHGATAGEMEQEVENGIPRGKTWAEESPSLVSSSAESLVAEDTIYASLKAELEVDGQEFEAESWSLAVDQTYAKKQSKEVIKRQDVIYELMQTEMHHVRTLKIMLHVYCRGMEEELQPNNRHIVNRIFPCLRQLLEIHKSFFSRLKERQKSSLEEGSERNYLIQRIGDVLTHQFSGECGDEMKAQYGDFCGQHNEAMNCYKVMYQQSKKFQNLIKRLSNYSVVRRLGVQECILLVTQRITKYPVLVERIIQNTEAGSEDHEELTKALVLIKDTITEVDERVSLCEKARRLKQIGTRLDIKSTAKLKNGSVFNKISLFRGKRKLVHEGVVCWKAASGRLKDILALLLSDVILLLQEKDQKYFFATVDQKPAGISLHKLIVREVANEEKGMFLISASDEGPEMYEIHTNSKEERNIWMTVIRDAIDRPTDLPLAEFAFLLQSEKEKPKRYSSEEPTITGDQEEEWQQDEGRAARIKEFQQQLSAKDDMLRRTLTEKLDIYNEIAEVNGYLDTGRQRPLLRADTVESQRGDVVFTEVLKEVEKLQSFIGCQSINLNWPLEDNLGSSGLPRRAETFGGYDNSSVNPSKEGSMKKKSNMLSSNSELKEKAGSRASSDTQLQDLYTECESVQMSDLSWCFSSNSLLYDSEFVQSVQRLTHQLYKLKVLIAQQDSYIEMQRSMGASWERDRQYRPSGSRGSQLLEQEKQRNLEKQREERANVQKLQNQVRQEQQKWERECDRQKRELDLQQSRLQEREESVQKLTEQLSQEKEELERHRQEYQQDLERLRESQRTVEKERERLEQQQRKQLKQNAVVFTSDIGQIPGFAHSHGLDGDKVEMILLAQGEVGLAQHGVKDLGQPSTLMEHSERPSEIPLQRENSTASIFARTPDIRQSLISKPNVPIHLVSTTNESLKHAGVQQKIPTKLATLKGGKEKAGKAKDRQSIAGMPSAAGLFAADARQGNLPRIFVKDDLMLKGRRSSSPVISTSQSFSLLEPVDIQPEPLVNAMPSGSSQSAPTITLSKQASSRQDDSGNEIIFF